MNGKDRVAAQRKRDLFIKRIAPKFAFDLIAIARTEEKTEERSRRITDAEYRLLQEIFERDKNVFGDADKCAGEGFLEDMLADYEVVVEGREGKTRRTIPDVSNAGSFIYRTTQELTNANIRSSMDQTTLTQKLKDISDVFLPFFGIYVGTEMGTMAIGKGQKYLSGIEEVRYTFPLEECDNLANFVVKNVLYSATKDDQRIDDAERSLIKAFAYTLARIPPEQVDELEKEVCNETIAYIHLVHAIEVLKDHYGPTFRLTPASMKDKKVKAAIAKAGKKIDKMGLPKLVRDKMIQNYFAIERLCDIAFEEDFRIDAEEIEMIRYAAENIYGLRSASAVDTIIKSYLVPTVLYYTHTDGNGVVEELQRANLDVQVIAPDNLGMIEVLKPHMIGIARDVEEGPRGVILDAVSKSEYAGPVMIMTGTVSNVLPAVKASIRSQLRSTSSEK